VGTVVAGTVSAVKATHLDVTLSNRWRGRVHITEAALQPADAGLAAKFAVGDPLEAEVLGVAQASDGSNTGATRA
jgi:ribosomal protein S1